MKKKPIFPCTKSIVLVGMMGVGKTTIGRRLAPKLGLDFLDADDEIEKAAGMRIAELFSQHGEAHFRQGEAQVIKRLLSGRPIVLATGGGAVINPQTRAIIKSQALSIWMRAPVDIILERATRRKTRPLLMTGDPKATINRLMKERQDYYAEADCHVDAQTGSHTRTVNALLEVIKEKLTDEQSSSTPQPPEERTGQ